MDRDDVRIAAVLEELAVLGRRIGERAGELARLTTARRRPSAAPQDEALARVAAAANHLASGAAAVVAGPDRSSPECSSPTRSSRSPQREAARQGAAIATVHRTVPSGGRERRRSAVVIQTEGRRSGAARSRSRIRSRGWAVGPVLASSLVHVMLVSVLAMMFVAVKAEPVRLALTIGDAAEPSLEEATLVSIDTPAVPDEAVELLAAEEPIDVDPLSPLEPAPSEALLAESPSAADVGESAMESVEPGALLSEIGGGEGKPAAGGERGGAAAGGPAATFFGRAGQGKSVCFICDNSNSHRDGSFHAVLEELARAVDALKPGQSFFVIFASDAAYPLFHPAAVGELQPATAENKQKLRAWLGTVEMCRGGQGIHEAVRLAGALGAEVVYLLSDGELGGTVVERLEGADFGGAAVHTFGMQQSVIDRRTGLVDPDRLREQQGHDRNLATIALAHGGTFTPVVIPPQAAALERLRPIPRNRSRGGVWGLKL